jgi:aubergine-like protein
MSYKGEKGGRGKGGESGGKGYGGGKGEGKGGGKGGKGGKGPDYTPAARVETCPPPKVDAKMLPKTYVGPISWSGKDTERDGDGKFIEPKSKKGAGTSGTPTEVVVNMMPLNLMSQQRNLYRVDFVPEQEQRRVRLFLLHQVLDEKKQKWASDGEHLLYTSELIDGKKELELTTKRNVTREEEETVQIKLKWTSHQKATLDKPSIMFFCSRFRMGMMRQKERQQIGADYFDFSQSIEISQHRCQLVPGLDCTVYVTETGPVMSVDMQHKHVRTDTVWNNMCQVRGLTDQEWQKAVSMAFESRIVLLGYTDPKRTVHVKKIRWDLTPQSKFHYKKKDKQYTYAQYMTERYGIKNSDMDKKQPLLEHESKTEHDREGKPKVSHFIPSLCHLTGQTDDMKSDRRRAQDLIRYTAMKPHDRLDKIMTNMKATLANKDFQAELQPWGLQIEPKLLRFNARRLPTPKMVNGGFAVSIKADTEAWDVKFDWPMFRSTNALKNWSIVTYQQHEALKSFVTQMQQVARELRIEFSPPKIFITKGGSQKPADYEAVIRSEVKAAKPSMVLVCVAKRDEPYKTIKRLLSCEFGVPSQFVQQEELVKNPAPKNLQKANKVVVQMNCKGSGAPWMVDMQLTSATMFVGLDVHHGGDLERKQASVAAFVASFDPNCTQYYSRTFLVKSDQQIMVPATDKDPGLKSLMMDALGKFKERNKTLPKYVVVYRDGGSEGELEVITKNEVKQFKEALEAAAKEAQPEGQAKKGPKVEAPKLVFFVVLKKIRTRFFAVAQGPDVRVANPIPGTIIDTNITSPLLQEFYLCCQSVNQGSATPTKYQKLCDNSDLTTDTLQQWTYNLSHMYFNWYGTVRVPAPMMYASTLAKLIGTMSRGRDVFKGLHSVLHYL